MVKRFIVFQFCFLVAQSLVAQTSLKIQGIIKNAFSQSTIEGAELKFTPLSGQDYTSISDSLGRFVINDIIPGRYNIIIQATGFQTHQIANFLIGRTNIQLSFEIKPINSELPEIIISDRKSGAYVNPLSNALLVTREETEKLPAGFFDPARLFTNQTGVSSANDGANHLIIRGNNPAFVKWTIHGTEILNPNHLSNAGTLSDQASPSGGGVNMISASVLDNTYLYKAPYDATRGNALAGAIDLNLRRGNIEKLTTEAQISLLGMELGLEGPLSKHGASFVTRYRYSTVGLLSKLGAQFGDENINYQDVMVHANFPARKSNLSFFLFTGNNMNDYLGVRDSTARTIPKEWNDINFKSNQTIAGMLYESRISDHNRLLTDVIYSRNKNSRTSIPIDFPALNNKDQLEEQKWNIHSRWVSVLGDNKVWTTGVQLQANKNTSLIIREGNEYDFCCGQTYTSIEPYSNLLMEFGKLSFQGGLHSLISGELSLEPRIQLGYQLSGPYVMQWSFGKYSQVPGLLNIIDQGKNLLMRSLQGQWSLRRQGLKHQWGAAAYLQYHYKVPESNLMSIINEAQVLNLGFRSATSKGNVYGIELDHSVALSTWNLSNNLAVFKSTFISSAGKKFPSRFDQRYNFHSSIGREWDKEKTNSRKILGWYSSVLFTGALKDTPYNSTDWFSIHRAGLFRLDTRIYRRKFYKHVNTLLALDIQNITNQKNFASSYFDVRSNKQAINYQLGILPNLSFTIEY